MQATARMLALRRLAVAGTVTGASLWAADVTANDEWDDVWGSLTRTRLGRPRPNEPPRPKVVVLGTGWGACTFLRKLHTDKVDVTVVSPRNYFTYTPLLCGTTVGTVEPRSIVEPIRSLCARSDAAEVRYVQAECMKIDHKNNRVTCRDSSSIQGNVDQFDIEYDHLVVAVGARPNTFGIPGVQENGLFLKEVEHSSRIRDRIADLLETASLPGQTDETINRLLHFVVVGAGPTGIEFAAELHDFLSNDIPRAFPSLDPESINITVFEAMPHVLGAFDEQLRAYTEEQFQRERISIRKNTMVTGVDAARVTVRPRGSHASPPAEEEYIPYGLLVWVAGIGTRPLAASFAKSLPPEMQNSRRGIVVDEYMRVRGVPSGNVFAIGDCAVSGSPPTAQVASQQGKYLARMFNEQGDGHRIAMGNAELLGKRPFTYDHRGSFAYVGDSKAVAQIPSSSDDIRLTGRATYAAWRAVYWSKLLSFRNRCLVAADWAKTHVFGRDTSRS